ncbi:MAG: peptidylprolyl isomerase [Parcubacteria group bacterium]|jgi:cyclophilin family peptidyl-prolyl cis-trans isomerase
MRSKILLSLSFIAIVMLLSGCSSQQSGSISKNQKNMDQNQTQNTDHISSTLNAKSQEKNNDVSPDVLNYTEKYNAAEIETNLGKIKVKFYNAEAPITVNNFMKLSDQKFYDGIKFHRVIKGFMIQGGDPNSKTGDSSTWGTGGPGYKFNDELKGTEKYPQGTLAMANSGPNTNGSQFFIVTASPEAPLPPSYTVFGIVLSGMDTALKIENVKTGANDRPVEDVVIKSIMLLNEK